MIARPGTEMSLVKSVIHFHVVNPPNLTNSVRSRTVEKCMAGQIPMQPGKTDTPQRGIRGNYSVSKMILDLHLQRLFRLIQLRNQDHKSSCSMWPATSKNMQMGV